MIFAYIFILFLKKSVGIGTFLKLLILETVFGPIFIVIGALVWLYSYLGLNRKIRDLESFIRSREDDEFLKNIEEYLYLISQNDFKQLFYELKEFYSRVGEDEYYDELIQLESRYNFLLGKVERGSEIFNCELNRIRQTLIHLIRSTTKNFEHIS